ncbi:hypothetical protein [Nocardioides psychrotolerans]|uniref:hypothetical protein n=1 Tax=Nocardioides psychrotolerans TaxID=1005945 RepID=UPI003137B30E
MKKLIAALFAAVLMSLGLVGFSTGSATAACPYTGCIPTSTSASGSVDGKFLTVTANVTTAGNDQPRGTVKITADRIGGKGFKSRGASVQAAADGVKLKLQRAGTWEITVTYVPTGNSVYSSSSTSFTVVIRRG